MEFQININKFWHDPYPFLEEIQALAPVVFVPQLDAALITRRIDVFTQEKRVDLLSSRQPLGLMTRLMGENMMRKDGAAHTLERQQIFPSLSPRTVVNVWQSDFETITDKIINELKKYKSFDLVKDFALPVSGAALVAMTGLRQMAASEMDQVSQAMIDGCANYKGDPSVEATCNSATQVIERHIDLMIPELKENPNNSVLSVLIQAGQPTYNIKANVKLVISGGQNEPRDAIAGTAAALLIHPLAFSHTLKTNQWNQALMEYLRWMSPIGMSPRKMTRDCNILGYNFKKDDRVFLMYGAANRDPSVFEDPSLYDVHRSTRLAIPFGAGPHFCAGAAASKTLIAGVALPKLFAAFPGMTLTRPVKWGGWAFRGPLAVNVMTGL
jgi:cytochrome P450